MGGAVVWGIFSSVQGYHVQCGGYVVSSGGLSFKLLDIPHTNQRYPSTLLILHSTEWYPITSYLISSTVLAVSLHRIDGIPPKY